MNNIGSDLDVLGELGRATTAYHEAPPERLETARKDYERALHTFNTRNSQASTSQKGCVDTPK